MWQKSSRVCSSEFCRRAVKQVGWRMPWDKDPGKRLVQPREEKACRDPAAALPCLQGGIKEAGPGTSQQSMEEG